MAFQKRFPDATLLLGFTPDFYIKAPTALGCNFRFTETSGFVVEPIVKEPEDVDRLEVERPNTLLKHLLSGWYKKFLKMLSRDET